MSGWLADFWHAYRKRPFTAVGTLFAVVLAVTFLSVAFSVRYSLRGVGVPASTTDGQPAQGQAPGPGSGRVGPGSAPSNCASGMPPGAGDSDSTNSWYARHCIRSSSPSSTTIAPVSPTARPSARPRVSTPTRPVRSSPATPVTFQTPSVPVATPTGAPTVVTVTPTTPSAPITTTSSTSPAPETS
jgi:hypothetical protein